MLICMYVCMYQFLINIPLFLQVSSLVICINNDGTQICFELQSNADEPYLPPNQSLKTDCQTRQFILHAVLWSDENHIIMNDL